MKRITYIIALLVLSSSIYSQDNTKQVGAINQAGIELYQTLVIENPTTNVFISPYSISNAMATTYNGAIGETKVQIKKAFGYENELNKNNLFFQRNNQQLHEVDSFNQLIISNALWLDETYIFNPDFTENSNDYLNTKTNTVTFKTNSDRETTCLLVNQWVDQNTQGKINHIISPDAIDEQTKLIITNAIYFKGIWKNPFKESNTRPNNFININGKTAQINFMNNTAEYLFLEEEELKLIEIPYAKNKFSFIAILPQHERTLYDIESTFSENYLSQLLANSQLKKVQIAIPKFTNNYESELKDSYIKMEMTLPFSDQANFSGINSKNELKIDQIYHKTFFSIDEQGSEAAASTTVVIATKSAMLHPNEFIANKPFMYLIKENETGIILFIGRKVVL